MDNDLRKTVRQEDMGNINRKDSLMKKAAVVFITLIVAASTTARTITVDDDSPADFNNIQAAIDDANDGDTIIVADGTYTGDGNRDIDFKGKTITLRSANGPENCIIDCNGTSDDPHRGFYFHTNEDANSILAGFNIKNGYAPMNGIIVMPPEPAGGAICCLESSPTLTDCIITGNTAQERVLSASGAGIYCRDANMVIANCIIKGNGKVPNWMHDSVGTACGGGICLSGGCVKIVNCTIRNNGAFMGGGLSCDGSQLSVLNCNIDENGAGAGGGVFLGGYALLSNCRITNNQASGSGGGISWPFDPNGIIENCVISGNSVSANEGMGSAVFLQNGNVEVHNCTICLNWFHSSGDPDSGAVHCKDISPIITNCILWANEKAAIAHGDPLVSYSNIEGGWPGHGNIDTDPCFADAEAGDYHLKSQVGRWDANEGRWTIDDVTSPCIDAGDPLSPIGYEPFPNGGIVNMGAYGRTAEASKSYFGEPPCETIVAGDINGDCEINFEDFRLMALHWCEEWE